MSDLSYIDSQLEKHSEKLTKRILDQTKRKTLPSKRKT